jgi:2-polyprenyl-6-methoxyphenol hydroxylase-like FAD-dependent oxidoreductase
VVRRDAASGHSVVAANVDDLRRWIREYFVAEAALRRVGWSALFRVHSLLVERFRAGDVFLVGDAAHLHGPAGGQGMNLVPGPALPPEVSVLPTYDECLAYSREPGVSGGVCS